MEKEHLNYRLFLCWDIVMFWFD